ncbi:phage head closure protein [Enterococcus faecalis]|uniref:phage head closure protein n=1 Tax=Enterococcus faecalis TaxID=1351 RepID=UPI0011589E8D|nr:phage head closure protein [Enterococcus faecalis]EHU8854514.1 phage head closure protein [Enterococcus faecalis]UYY06301.1 phage head closure protein [Enterococcus faecalis]HBG9513119.1 phage head closure protein [Enterococcus faecalis]HBG9520593.1 phage head closure protein [Enterococcus faecalis]
MKRLSDDRYKAELLHLEQTIDENDRPIKKWVKVRDLFHSELGITANEQFISAQEKSNVVRKIGFRYDPLLLLDRSEYRIKIGELMYKIERVYTDMPNERMELSLAYVK